MNGQSAHTPCLRHAYAMPTRTITPMHVCMNGRHTVYSTDTLHSGHRLEQLVSQWSMHVV